MAVNLEEKIENNISNIVLKLGLEIEYIEIVNEDNNNIVRIVIDKPEKIVSIDDCEMVSRAIEESVEKCVDENYEYILEVSSPGLERQLKNIKLFLKYINSDIYVKLVEEVEYGEELEGKLIEVDEENNSIVIQIIQANELKNIHINLNNIVEAHTIFDFDKV